jgi:hypothetical protein
MQVLAGDKMKKQAVNLLRPRTVIQVVSVRWSKRARGGALATARNRVPLALPLDLRGFDASEDIWIERYSWGEPDFACPQRMVLAPKAGVFHGNRLVLTHAQQQTTVVVKWSSFHGAPRRFSSTRFELGENQWARVRWNERHVDFDFGFWGYSLETFNIARVCGEPAPSLFTATAPTLTFESLAPLR